MSIRIAGDLIRLAEKDAKDACERRIAEAVAAERERVIAIYESIFNLPKEGALRYTAAIRARSAEEKP